MDGYGSGHQRPYASYNDRRLEVVSGKNTDLQFYKGSRAAEPEPAGANRSKPWGFGDPEIKRKKRIARYNAYTVEGKVKASLRRGLHWIKNKCSQVIHGY